RSAPSPSPATTRREATQARCASCLPPEFLWSCCSIAGLRRHYMSRAGPRQLYRRMPASRLTLSAGRCPPRIGGKRAPSTSRSASVRVREASGRNKMSMLRAKRIIICGAAVFGLATAASAQEVKHYRFAHDQQLNSGYSIAYDIFSAKLKQLSGGKMVVDQYP